MQPQGAEFYAVITNGNEYVTNVYANVYAKSV